VLAVGGLRAGRSLADQVQPLDADRLGRRLGSLNSDELIELEAAVRKVLGLR
jgi:mRNA-degrading endonuclease toxin of MazEF toxin-antitoxin module